MLRVSTVLLSLSVLAAALPVGAKAQQAQDSNGLSGFYTELRGGVNFLDNARNSGNANPIFPTGTAKTDFGTGFTLGAAIGYKFSDRDRWGSGFWNGVRTELEVGYGQDDINVPMEQFENSQQPDIDGWRFMANTYYDIDTGTRFTPYVGAGLGFTSLDLNNAGLSDKSDTTFTYQFRGGVDYALTKQFSVNVGYRYLDTDNPKFTNNDGSLFQTEYNSHAIELGLRYSF